MSSAVHEMPDAYGIVTPGKIRHIGFVTRNLEKACAGWTRLLGAGPFLSGEVKGMDCIYRGGPGKVNMRVAAGYSGDVQIQIAQPTTDEPNVYNDMLNRCSGDSFHHIILWTENMDAVVEHYRSLGVEPISDQGFRGIQRVVFFDTIDELGGTLEYSQIGDHMRAELTKMHELHLNWDGKTEPLRPTLFAHLEHHPDRGNIAL